MTASHALSHLSYSPRVPAEDAKSTKGMADCQEPQQAGGKVTASLCLARLTAAAGVATTSRPAVCRWRAWAYGVTVPNTPDRGYSRSNFWRHMYTGVLHSP